MVDITVPMLDLRQEVDELSPQLHAAIGRVLRSGQFVLGSEVEALEHEVAKYLGVKHAVGVASGTDALLIGLRALGVGPGDEVITTSFSFVATAFAIVRAGARPVMVDVDPLTFNLDVGLVEAAITSRTRAVVPVHLYGQAADMKELMSLAQLHGLHVLEDAAQALGGDFDGRKLGTFGTAAAFSFFPTKVLGAYGDGGMLVTHDDEVASLARALRVQGAHRRYASEIVGYNSRLDALQAAILRVKLPQIDDWIARRREIAGAYDAAFSELENITAPHVDRRAGHAYHQYTVRVRGGPRDDFRNRLRARGVQSTVYYPCPLPDLDPLAEFGGSGPQAQAAAREVVSLPIWPQMPSNARAVVIEAVRDGASLARHGR